MPIVSGPTGERKIRSTLLFLMIAGFAGWFAYDGWVGWPAENLREHLQELPAAERPAAARGQAYQSVTDQCADQAEKAIKLGDRSAIKAALEKTFGGPPSYENQRGFYYFGPSYRVAVHFEGDRPSVVAKRTAHGPIDLLGQKLLAGTLGVFAVYLLYFVIKVRRTQLVLNESGLSYHGRPTIPWTAMRSLDSSRFQEKGWVDLHYDSGGASAVLRLDEYHLQAFDAILDEICRRKGFDNPLPVKQEGPDQPAETT